MSPPMIELTVERPANGGEAVGRADGRVVFVRGAIPGETVRVRIVDQRHPSFWRGETIEILDASPFRVPQRCPAAAHGAGCCDLGFIRPDHARDLKRDVLLDVAARIGHLPAQVLESTALVGTGVEALAAASGTATASADAATGWRVRTRLAVDGDGVAGQRAFRGDDVITGGRCVAPVAGLLDDIGGGFTPHAELVIVADAAGGRHISELAPIVEPVTAAGRRAGRGDRSRRGAQQSRHRRRTERATRVVEGAGVAEHRVGTRTWQIPVTGFWQAHREAPATYADAVAGFAARHLDRSPGVAWDLYGGAGVFAAALLDNPDVAPGSVHVVDADTGALTAAAATFAGDNRVITHPGEVIEQIEALPAPDVVVLDPPRSGAGEKVVTAISDARPQVIIHIGCDAARFARDLGLFVTHGYRIAELRGFDAFPLTHHVEAIACLVRG